MTTTVVHWEDRPIGGQGVDWVYIGRKGGGEFGNPYILGKDGDRAEVLAMYRAWFNFMLAAGEGFREKIEALRGKVLVCHCKPLACHGDVIAEYLNGGSQ